jgi:hypothetical protein
MECYSTATGCYSNAGWNNLLHQNWTGQGLGWLSPAQNNYLPTSVDYVYSGAIHSPFSAGTFVWPIPWNCRKNGATNDGYNFATLNHEATATATGRCTMSKNLVSVTFDPGDTTVNW